jgi:hypothetical protein
MTPELTNDQRLAIEQQNGTPVYLVDTVTSISYVLIRAEEYEKLKGLTGSDEASSMYPLLADIAPEDWEDASNYERQP